MKQNYNLLTSSTAFPHAWNSFFQKSKTHAGSLLVVLFMLFGFSDAFGQVNITKPNLSITACSGYPTTYFPLGNIVITETANANFSTGTGITLILTAPTNFEFQANVGSVSEAGQNLSLPAITVTATTITITYDCGGTNKSDVMTISGIMVRAINTASTGDITRTGGTGTINGLTNGVTLTNTLTSTTASAPTIADAGPDQNLAACTTSTTLAGNTASSGTGLWTLQSGTATITTPTSPTSGITGIVAGTPVVLRWTISNGCGSTQDEVTINSPVGPGCLTYCTPIGTNNTYPISNVTFAGINNTTSAVGGVAGPDYEDFSAITGNVTAGNTYNISVTTTGLSPNLFYQYVFFDWNNNGDFTDDGGAYTIGTYTTNTDTSNLNILIPVTAYVGTIRMRVGNSFNAIYDPCITVGGNFQFEDYSLNIASAPVCTEPTAQPTALVLSAAHHQEQL